MDNSSQILIRDFSGGQNKRGADTLNLNEASVLRGLFTGEGALDVMPSHTAGTAGNVYGLTQVSKWITFTADDGTTCELLYDEATDKLYHIDENAVTNKARPVLSASVFYSADKFGNYLYISQTGTNYGIMRFESFIFRSDTVNCPGTTAVTVTGATALTSIRDGDTIFIKGASSWRGPYFIRDVNTGTRVITINTALPESVTGADFIICRVHTAGIHPYDRFGTGVTSVQAGGTLADGTYGVAVTLYNSNTGYESPPDYLVAVTTNAGAGNQTIRVAPSTTNPGQVSGGQAFHSGWQADYFRIYRTMPGGSTYYLAQSNQRSSANYTFAAQYDMDGTETLGATLVTAGHELPPVFTRTILTYGSRLVALSPVSVWNPATSDIVDATTRNQVWISNLDEPEYFSQGRISAIDPTSLDSPETEGGYIAIGQSNITIVGAVPEVNIGGTSWRVGASLLLIPERGYASRLIGYDWDTWIVEQLFETNALGAIQAGTYFYDETVATWKGHTFWITDDGPVMLKPGGIAPTFIYDKLFSPESQWFSETNSNRETNFMSSCVWRDYYVFCWIEYKAAASEWGNVYHTHIAFYNIPRGTWEELPVTSTAAPINNPAGVRGFRRYYGVSASTASQYLHGLWTAGGSTWATGIEQRSWFSTTILATSTAIEYQGPLFLGDKGTETKILEVTEAWLLIDQRAFEPTGQSAAQTFAVTMLMDGNSTGTAVSNASTNGKLAWVKYVPHNANWQGFSFVPKITGTITQAHTKIKAMLIKYKVVGDLRV